MTNTGAILEAGLTQAVSPRGHLSNAPTFRSEMPRNLGITVSSFPDAREILATLKVDEGDAESRYTMWKATADLVSALAEGSLSEGGAEMRPSTYASRGEFPVRFDDRNCTKTDDHASNFRA